MLAIESTGQGGPGSREGGGRARDTARRCGMTAALSNQSLPGRLLWPLVTRRVPGSVVALTGWWRIVEMSAWDRDAIDLVEPGFIEFAGDGTGQFGFIAVRGQLDYRPVERDGRAGVEFTWDGFDEGDNVSGRGWAAVVDGETIEGHLFFHLGDDSSFRAKSFTAAVDGQ